MHIDFDPVSLIGYAGALFYVASAVVKRMVPLRTLALVSNACFVGYALGQGSSWTAPDFLLNVALLPVNAIRLREIHRLTHAIERANADTPLQEWLVPHMTRRRVRKGDILFRKGEHADTMLYLASGFLRVEGREQLLEPGALLGEIGLFAPDRTRTRTVTCETDAVVYTLTAERTYQLYFLNPKLSFYLVRLLVARLLRDAGVAAPRDSPAAAPHMVASANP